MSGFVYFIREGKHGPIKIGSTESYDAYERLKGLQTGNPRRLRPFGAIETSDPRELERELHELFYELRLQGGMWRVCARARQGGNKTWLLTASSKTGSRCSTSCG